MVSVRTRRLLLWVALPALVLVLLYTVLGFYLVPRLIRSGVDDFVTRNYHRKVAIGDVRFNPYSLRLDVRDFSLPDSDGKPMLSFAHLVIDLTVASLWRLGPDFESILLERPFARVMIKPDGTLNFSDLALPPSPNAKPEPNPKPVRLFINHLGVQGGNVAFEDLAHPSEFRTEIKPITFDLRNFSTVGKDGGTYELNGASEAGETFSWSGSLKANPLASHGQFTVGNLQAQTIWSYLRDSVQFELPSGAISIAGDYDFTAATSPVGLGVDVHEITVTDLGIRPRGGKDDYVKLARLEVHETRADVAKRTVDIGSVRLAGGELRAWMPGAAGAKVNLMELAGAGPTATTAPVPATNAPSTPSAATAPVAAAPPSPSWTVSVPDIALDNLKVSAEDRSISPAVPLQLDELSVHVNGFSTARTTPVAVTLSTRINREGKLDAKADLSADLASAKAQLELARFDLTMLQPYVAQKTAMTLRSGQLATRMNAERGADGHVAVSGEVDLTKFRTVDNELKRDFIKFDRVQTTGIDFQMAPPEPSKPTKMKLHVRTVAARAPYARVIIEADRTTNVSRVLSGPGGLKPAPADAPSAESASAAATVAPEKSADSASVATTVAPEPSAKAPANQGRKAGKKSKSPTAAPPAPEGPFSIAVDEITIQDGSANYADLWIQPNFAVGIQTLNGYIKGLSSDPRARAKVELNGKVDKYAPVRIWGETNPLAATAFTDIRMNFKGVELTSATPYSGRFAGYKIEKGKLSVDIQYRIENRQLNAAHKFVIDQLELGERVESPDAVHLPLKIAVALLKDRNGVIDLDLPVTGSLDDPKFKLGPIIWKAVLNLLTKIATAPFALLGHLFGGGEQMNFIDFRPGTAVLEPSERDKLVALAKALKEKEKLELDVPITYSPDLDRPGLAAAHLNLRLAELNQAAAGGRKKGKGAAKESIPAAGSAAEPPPAAIGKSASEAAATTAGPPGAEATPHASELMDAPPPADPALTDPTQRHRLLVEVYRTQMGKGAALPDLSRQIEESGKKKDQQPDFGAANTELEAALLQKIEIPDSELETLGKHRARAIQEVLLAGTDIDPSRVFVIGSAPKGAADKDKVRVELALK